MWAAVQAGRTIALANKEPLVVAGHLIMRRSRAHRRQLLPVDSEHSAIFQSLLGQDRKAVRRVVLTASGGAFRSLSPEELEHVTPEQALAHPTWRMGPKVTVDSATLMNKGLELIEARWLFGLAPEQLEVVLHRGEHRTQPGGVRGRVGAGAPGGAGHAAADPIRAHLSRSACPRPEPRLDLTRLGDAAFRAPRAGPLARVGLAPPCPGPPGEPPGAVLNAADEVAVSWFLAGRMKFSRIPQPGRGYAGSVRGVAGDLGGVSAGGGRAGAGGSGK